MAVLANNTFFLSLNAVVLCPKIIEVTLEVSNETIEITHGCDVDHVMRAAGLNDTKMTLKLAYDAADVDEYIQVLRPSTAVTVIYGSEGSTTGKPKHEQAFIVQSNKHDRASKKKMVEFEVTLEAADAPATDMLAGGVF